MVAAEVAAAGPRPPDQVATAYVQTAVIGSHTRQGSRALRCSAQSAAPVWHGSSTFQMQRRLG